MSFPVICPAIRIYPGLKKEAFREGVERGYSVAEISARPGVSMHRLHKCVKAVTPTHSRRAQIIQRYCGARISGGTHLL